MKTALICFGLMAVIFASAEAGALKAGRAEKAKQDYMDGLINQALKYLKKKLTPDTLLPVPIKDHIVLPNYDINMKLSNVVVSNLGAATVSQIKNNVSELITEIELAFPNPSAKGTYDINGVAFTHNVKGSGDFTASFKNLDLKAIIQFSVANGTFLNVESLGATYDVEGASLSFDNIKVDGVSDEQVKEFLSNNVLASVEKSKATISQKIATGLHKAANAILAGKNLMQISKWLRFANQ